jgi:phosphatidate cytidylyltransferase
MLKARLAVTAVGLPLLAALVIAPEQAFSIAVALALAGGAYELMRAAAPETGHPPAIATAALVALIVATARSEEEFRLWLLLLPLAVALVVALQPWRAVRWPELAWWAVSVLYLGALGGHWVLLRNVVDGSQWVAVALIATFATDTGAYAVGRSIGRHLLVPQISPSKTWEGFAGGVVAGAVGAVVAITIFDLDVGVATLVAIAVGLPVAAVAGDLLESAIKRRAEVKDMSALLPGHGGLLDRIDSLLLTGPLLYWAVQWFVT